MPGPADSNCYHHRSTGLPISGSFSHYIALKPEAFLFHCGLQGEAIVVNIMFHHFESCSFALTGYMVNAAVDVLVGSTVGMNNVTVGLSGKYRFLEWLPAHVAKLLL